MKRISSKTPAMRRGPLARLLAGLLVVAMMAVLCPMGSIPAQADTVPTLRNIIDSYGNGNGVVLPSGMDTGKVRTITFQNTKPTGTNCWDAGGGNGGPTDSSVRGCATTSASGSTLYDVVYGASNAYPRFPDDSNQLFTFFTGLVELVNLDKIDTSNVTNMSLMFSNCRSLKSLDVSNFKTSNVTDMSYMFETCSSLPSLNVSSLDTSNVTNMKGMFLGCSGLQSLDVSGFDTSNVTSGGGMLVGLSKLEELKLGGEVC